VAAAENLQEIYRKKRAGLQAFLSRLLLATADFGPIIYKIISAKADVLLAQKPEIREAYLRI
jgi:hypothetical protein